MYVKYILEMNFSNNLAWCMLLQPASVSNSCWTWRISSGLRDLFG